MVEIWIKFRYHYKMCIRDSVISAFKPYVGHIHTAAVQPGKYGKVKPDAVVCGRDMGTTAVLLCIRPPRGQLSLIHISDNDIISLSRTPGKPTPGRLYMGEKRMRSKWIIRIWLGRLTRCLLYSSLSYEPKLVEMRRLDLLTPCLPSRCSPS